MRNMPKIILEREKCIGCSACEAVCQEYWKMADDGKTNLLGAEEQGENEVLEAQEVGCNKDAADACPVQCIIIE